MNPVDPLETVGPLLRALDVVTLDSAGVRAVKRRLSGADAPLRPRPSEAAGFAEDLEHPVLLHQRFDLGHGSRRPQRQDFMPGFGYGDGVLDPDSDLFLR